MSDFINTIDILDDEIVCSSLIDRTITEIKDDVVWYLGNYALARCPNLVTVDFPNVTYIDGSVFVYSSALKNVNLPKCNYLESYAFNYCTGLQEIKLHACQYIGASAFMGCTNLEIVDLLYASIERGAFASCSKLKALIIRHETVASVLKDKGALSGTLIASGTGYIYVPSALVESYKTASGWSNYANQFRALEDYTVDGTITGELDPNKI